MKNEYPSVTVNVTLEETPKRPSASWTETTSNEDHAALKRAYQDWRDKAIADE